MKKASKSKRQNSWYVTYYHPLYLDKHGKSLRVRRGLGTKDSTEAGKLITQLNQLLADESYWTLQEPKNVRQKFDPRVCDAFYLKAPHFKIPLSTLRSEEIKETNEIIETYRQASSGTKPESRTIDVVLKDKIDVKPGNRIKMISDVIDVKPGDRIRIKAPAGPDVPKGIKINLEEGKPAKPSHPVAKVVSGANQEVLQQIEIKGGDPFGRPTFKAILDELNAMQERKGQDYGSTTDPLANICASQEFGVPPWLGAVLRANDKMARLKTFATKGNLANESVEDSLIDLAVYIIHALRLFREFAFFTQTPDKSQASK